MSDIEDFRRGYVEAMLWANAIDALTLEALEDMTYAYHTPGDWWNDTPVDTDDADSFYEAYADIMVETGETDYARHGHDFALTRNRHGAGFWDRGYGDIGETLSDYARAYGEAYVLIEVSA